MHISFSIHQFDIKVASGPWLSWIVLHVGANVSESLLLILLGKYQVVQSYGSSTFNFLKKIDSASLHLHQQVLIPHSFSIFVI